MPHTDTRYPGLSVYTQKEGPHAGALYAFGLGDSLSALALKAYGSGKYDAVNIINRSEWNKKNYGIYKAEANKCTGPSVNPELSMTTVGWGKGGWIALCPPWGKLIWIPKAVGDEPTVYKTEFVKPQVVVAAPTSAIPMIVGVQKAGGPSVPKTIDIPMIPIASKTIDVPMIVGAPSDAPSMEEILLDAEQAAQASAEEVPGGSPTLWDQHKTKIIIGGAILLAAGIFYARRKK